MAIIDFQNITSAVVGDKMEAVVLATLNAASLAINSLVFILFYRKPALRTFSNSFVLSLSVCHTVQSLLQMPYVVFSSILRRWVFGEIWCTISVSLSICFSLATAFSLLIIAADRSYAINSPLHYTMSTTRKTTWLQIFAVWAVAIIIALPPLFGLFTIEYRESWHTCTIAWHYGTPDMMIYSTILTVGGFLVPLFKLCLTYKSMYLAARKNSARAKLYQYQRKISSFKLDEEWRVIRTPIMVISSYIISSLPFYLVLMLETYTKEYIQPNWVMSIVNTLMFSSCVINPYLYVFRNKTTRKELRKLINRKRGNVCVKAEIHPRIKCHWTFNRSKDDTVSNSSEENFPNSQGELQNNSFDNPAVKNWMVSDADVMFRSLVHCSTSVSENNLVYSGLSKTGNAKRNSFILTRLGNSSDTTLTSTSSSGSQELSAHVKNTAPKLIRQHSATPSYPNHV